MTVLTTQFLGEVPRSGVVVSIGTDMETPV